MPKIKRQVEIVTKTVGSEITPIVTVSGIPTEVDVGDKIIPSVKVESAPATPVEGVSIDFFVEDSLQVTNIGDRQLTDINGDATASEGYYIGVPEASQTIYFIIVIHKKKLP